MLDSRKAYRTGKEDQNGAAGTEIRRWINLGTGPQVCIAYHLDQVSHNIRSAQHLRHSVGDMESFSGGRTPVCSSGNDPILYGGSPASLPVMSHCFFACFGGSKATSVIIRRLSLLDFWGPLRPSKGVAL